LPTSLFLAGTVVSLAAADDPGPRIAPGSGSGRVGSGVQLGRPLRLPGTQEARPIALGKPTSAAPLQQVGLSVPVGRSTFRGQSEEPKPLPPPTPVPTSNAGPPPAAAGSAGAYLWPPPPPVGYPLPEPPPAGPVPAGPELTPPPPGDPSAGWFDHWFGGWFDWHPGAVIPLKGLSLGAGVYFLSPHWESNPAYAVFRGTPVQIRQEDFSYHTEFAPYAFLSYTLPSGLGARSRFLRLDQDTSIYLVNDGTFLVNSAAPLGLQNSSAIPGSQLAFDSSLKMTVLDFEALQRFQFGLWGLELSGGVRYSHISQSYNHVEWPPIGPFDAISSGHNFRGAGPTLAVEVRRSLGCCGLSLYGNARGAVLFGSGKQNAFLASGGSLLANAAASRSDFVPVTELEIGLDYSKPIKSCRFFVQAALVGQVWYGVGNAANNDLITPLTIGLAPVADNQSNLGLFGGKLAMGLEF
jgi:hypothetical protein